MAVIQNNSQSDKHLILFEKVNQETGEGKTIEYIIPHKILDRNDDKKVIDTGRREIPDADIQLLRQNKVINALFNDGILVEIRGDVSEKPAEKRNSEYDGSVSNAISTEISKANAKIVVPKVK